uniref:Beta-1,6-N-acetylglucosaminyltransferase n=1 Tax=Strongyloides papillosus TaxID=174720 RepID=A0A0N5BQ33_STREA
MWEILIIQMIVRNQRSNLSIIMVHYLKKKRTNESISLTCEAIKKRRYFTSVPLSREEKNFPLAYSYLVYRDYEFLELMLSLIYQPQNIYCFAIDKKQPPSFKFKIHSLASCFDNVFVSDKEYKISSGGLHYGTSHIECIKKIKEYNWKYVFLLQNHDFPIKTNAELVKILKQFKGTSDFKAANGKRKLLNETLDWTFGGLNIFLDTLSIDEKVLNTEIKLGKGYSEVTLSRETVDYLMDNLNISTYQNNFDNYHKFANDEVFWSTLLSNYEYLKVPGSIPTHCIHKKEAMISFTRYSKWEYGKKEDLCPSGHKRHSICIIGLEHIGKLESLRYFFANKLLDSFDHGAVTCWGERIFNKTYFPSRYKEVDLSPYLSRLQVLNYYYIE